MNFDMRAAQPTMRLRCSRSIACPSNRRFAPCICESKPKQLRVAAMAAAEGHGALPGLRNLAMSLGSAAILLCSQPIGAAWADMQTVPATQALQMARPLPQQQVDKGRVWTVFIGGAVALFLGTLAVENNPSFFPAISRANKAASDARKASEAAERRAQATEVSAAEVKRQTALVEEGLREAKQRVLPSRPSPAPSPSPPAQQQQTSASPSSSGAHSSEAPEAELAAVGAHSGVAEAAGEQEAAAAAAAAKQARLASFVGGMTGEGQPALMAGAKAGQQSGKDAANSS